MVHEAGIEDQDGGIKNHDPYANHGARMCACKTGTFGCGKCS